MEKPIGTLPFAGTAEQAEQLDSVVTELKGQPGAVMLALQQAQKIYGYLPVEVQQVVADGLGEPLAEVYGVSTFYSMFLLSPKGRNVISVCMGTACYVKGSGEVLDKIASEIGIKAEETSADGNFSLTACRCIGACGLAPVITINDDVYGKLTADQIPEILDKYRV